MITITNPKCGKGGGELDGECEVVSTYELLYKNSSGSTISVYTNKNTTSTVTVDFVHIIIEIILYIKDTRIKLDFDGNDIVSVSNIELDNDKGWRISRTGGGRPYFFDISGLEDFEKDYVKAVVNFLTMPPVSNKDESVFKNICDNLCDILRDEKKIGDWNQVYQAKQENLFLITKDLPCASKAVFEDVLTIVQIHGEPVIFIPAKYNKPEPALLVSSSAPAPAPPSSTLSVSSSAPASSSTSSSSSASSSTSSSSSASASASTPASTPEVDSSLRAAKRRKTQ